MADELKNLSRQILLQQIEILLEDPDKAQLQQLLVDRRTSDIAEIVELLDDEQRRIIFDVLEKPTAAEVLEKVDEATRGAIFDLLTAGEIKTIISELDPDDAADLIAEFHEAKRDKLLKSLEPADSLLIKKLMSYSEDSAGGIMDPVLISVSEDATVAEAVNKIRAAEIDEDFYSVFVVDTQGKFLGDVRIRFLLTRPENTRISDLIEHDTIYVVAEDDQERVRNVFRDNDLIVVPVLDKGRKLIGRITADRVIEVADEEAAEDIYAMAGTDPAELEKESILWAAGVRMTWLFPCLFGTGITALVLILFDRKFAFEDMAFVYTAAVAFAPMIAAISGNAGLQTSAIVVSGLATGHLADLKLSQVFTREVRIALLVALACGFVSGSVCALLLHFRTLEITVQPLHIVFALSTAMFLAIVVATTLGLSLPFVFRRIGIDPAISSGPLVTTANDSISVAIYMTLTLLLVG
jgi:magnesium transporter